MCYNVSHTMASRTLTKTLHIRITEEQRAALEDLAAHDHRSVGAVVRRFIREGLERERWEMAEEVAA